MLTETSRRFHGLTGGRGLISDFRVVLPASWAGSDCAVSKVGGGGGHGNDNNGAAADMLVTGGGGGGGRRPRSQQHGQCGTPGLRVEIPYPGLLSLDDGRVLLPSNLTRRGGRRRRRRRLDDADALLKEWVKFRFGVFEEVGFRGDPIYPVEFPEGEEVRTAVGCNSSEVGNDKFDNFFFLSWHLSES